MPPTDEFLQNFVNWQIFRSVEILMLQGLTFLTAKHFAVNS